MEEQIGFCRKLTAVATLFRFSRFFDVFLLLLGTLAAIAHGVALPVSMHYFGDLTNIFVNHFTSKTLANFEFRYEVDDLLDSNCIAAIDITILFSEFINFTNFSGGVVNCSEDFVLVPDGLTFNKALTCGVTQLAQCLDDETFIPLVDSFVIGFACIGAIVWVVGTIQVFAFQLTSSRQTKSIKERFFRAVLCQEAKWFDQRSSGELSSRLASDIEKIHEGIGVKLALFLQWVTTFIAGFVVGFIREWRLTLLLLGITPLITITIILSYALILVLTSREQQQLASASGVAEEAFSAIRTVVAYGGEKVEADRYESCLQEARKTGNKRGFINSLSLGIIYFFIFLCYAIGFWFGAWRLSEQAVQAGDLITVFFAVIIGIFSLGQAVPHLEKFISAAGASLSIYSIIDQGRSVTSLDSSSALDINDRSVEFKNVNFAYPSRPDKPVLKDFSLKVDVGQTVALVGPSGCGKTTAIQLLMRFYEISSGQVLMGETDVRSLGLHELREKFGLVGQEPVLFDTSVAENIAMGTQGAASMDLIEKAGRDANIHDFVVSELPHGYSTNVGKQGTQMSGGQKQRIAIARALIRNPQILLLDDATSALDSESERVVQEALDRASSSRTTIIISHRLSTIKSADVIAYMEKGGVVELGSHDQLMSMEGAYYNFAVTQYGDLTPDPSEPSVVVELGEKLTRQRITSTTSNGAPKGDIELSEISQGNTGKGTTPQNDENGISWSRVWKMNLADAHLIALGLLGATVQGIIYPMFAYFFGQVIRVFTLPFDQVLAAVHVWAGTFLILGTLSGLATFLKNITFFVSSSRLTRRLRVSTFRSILHQEMAWFDQKKNSPALLTAQLADDAGQVQGATGVQFGSLVESGVSIVAAIVISLVADQLLALVIIGFLPFLLLPSLLQVCVLSAYNSTFKRHNDEAEKIATDSINNHQTVRALSVEDKFLTNYSNKLDSAYRYAPISGLLYGLTYAIAQGAIFFGYAITFRFGAYQSVQPFNGPFYVGLDGVYTVFLALIFGTLALGQSHDFAPNYTKAKHAAKRVFALLDRRSAVDSASGDGLRPDSCAGAICLSNVEFSYPTRPGVSVMRSMSLTAKANQTTALVGPSGYGKSTIMSLIERFYDPLSGSITIDGHELNQVNIEWLRLQMGIVFQEPVLFDRSIADNIKYGANHKTTVSTEEIEEAAKNANIHDFIMSLPMGYDTVVGEGGTLLSRGEKQRIAIARALLRDPKLLLLDEATSALDSKSEKEVQSVLDQAMKNRSSIVIAHRLATIHRADKIAVLRRGKVSEEGSHSNLMEKDGLYRKMYLYQTRQT